MSRTWALLLGEIDRGGFAPAETKLVNFEDEVWSAVQSQRISTLASGTETSSNATPRLDEAAVRANVQRLLRTEDPVFALLMRRVTGALGDWLESRPAESDGIASTNGGGQSIPVHMQTGRKRPGLPALPKPSNGTSSSSSNDAYPKSRWDPKSIPVVKGFEGKVLREALEDVASQLGTAVEWVEITWSDVINPGTGPDGRLGSGATHA